MHVDPSFQPARWILGFVALVVSVLFTPLPALFERFEPKMNAHRLIARILRRADRAKRRG